VKSNYGKNDRSLKSMKKKEQFYKTKTGRKDLHQLKENTPKLVAKNITCKISEFFNKTGIPYNELTFDEQRQIKI